MKETKVYVDELPKSCWECPCFKNDLEFPCGLSDGTQDYFKDEIDGENCPLVLLKTHDRELVNEVCEKIKHNISKLAPTIKIEENNFETITGHGLDLVFKEIQKE